MSLNTQKLKEWVESHNPEHEWTWDDLGKGRDDLSQHIEEGTLLELFRLFELASIQFVTH